MIVSQLINDNYNPASNQFVITTKKGIYFQSYDSVIAFIPNNGKITLSGNWDYSNTTRKHLYIFFRSNGIHCFNSRKEVLKGIRSGEIKIKQTSVLPIR